jgi:RNA polymerase sigma-70 factor (ECF subfamily)
MAATASDRAPVPAQVGDEEALYRAHHSYLRSLIARDVSARPQVIEDACAHAWAELLARQPQRTSIVGWLRVVAQREAIRLAQRDRVTVSLSRTGPRRARDAWSTACATGTPEQHCEALEALALVAALPDRKRAVLNLKIAGHSYDEIAEHLGVTHTNVNHQLARARAAMRVVRGDHPPAS